MRKFLVTVTRSTDGRSFTRTVQATSHASAHGVALDYLSGEPDFHAYSVTSVIEQH